MPKRTILRAVVLVIMLGAAAVVAPPAHAFHESLAEAQLRVSPTCSDADAQIVGADGVKSFNETLTGTGGALKARSAQNTSVSSSADLSVNTTGEVELTASEESSHCGTAQSRLTVFGESDDDESGGQGFFFTVFGSLSFEDGSEGLNNEDGNISWSFGGVAGENRFVNDDETITVAESGFTDNFPTLQVSISASLVGIEGFSRASWELTLNVFSSDTCPPSGPAAAGGAESTSVPLSASSADFGVNAAAECPVPTVGFTNDEGFDGGIRETEFVAFLVQLSPAQSTEVVVNFQVGQAFDHEATAGEDFEAAQGQLTFPPGATLKTIEVPLINDAVAEPDELFAAVLTPSATSGTPVTLGKDVAFAIVRDDDCALHVPSASTPNDITVPAGTTGAVCGSVSPDRFRGSDAGDLILGGAGADVLVGRGGQDTLNGGVGADKLFGGFAAGSPFVEPGTDPSRDFLIGGPPLSRGIDDDEIFGEAGNDVIEGGSGVDRMNGGEGNDLMFAGDRPASEALANTALYVTDTTNGDVLFGDVGNDTLHGSSGDNLLFGGSGNDTIYGHAGQDRLNGEAGSDSLREGPVFSPDLVKDVLVGGDGAGEFDFCFATPVIDDKIGCEA